MDIIGSEAAVKALAPMVDAITNSINGAVDRLESTVITIGPITIPAFTIRVGEPGSEEKTEASR
jgi:hypothetical protein